MTKRRTPPKMQPMFDPRTVDLLDLLQWVQREVEEHKALLEWYETKQRQGRGTWRRAGRGLGGGE